MKNEAQRRDDGAVETLGKAFSQFADAAESRIRTVEDRQRELESELVKSRTITASGIGSDADRAKGAFTTYLRKGDAAPMSELVPSHVKAMSEGSATDGGAAVPLEIDALIAKKARDVNILRQMCSVVQVSSQSYRKLISVGGTGATWVGETDARPATATPTVQPVNINPGELYAHALASQWILDDVQFDLAQWLVDEIGEQFAQAEQTAFVSGNGSNRPAGFLAATTTATADGSRTFGQIQHVNTGVAGNWPASDAGIYDLLNQVLYTLRTRYRGNAAWLMASPVLERLMRVKDSQNNPIFMQPIAGQPPLLLGRPVYTCEAMPVVAANSLSVALADWRAAYLIVDRIGTRVLRDPYTNKPNVGFYVTRRVGGAMVDDDAIKLIRFGT